MKCDREKIFELIKKLCGGGVRAIKFFGKKIILSLIPCLNQTGARYFLMVDTYEYMVDA